MSGKGKPGPDKIEVDPARLETLAKINCTHEEMASVLGMSIRTFQERLAEDPELRTIIEKNRDEGKASLRRAQWKSALGGDRTMMIWLGKNHLGQTDRQAVEHSGGMSIDYGPAARALLDRLPKPGTDSGDSEAT